MSCMLNHGTRRSFAAADEYFTGTTPRLLVVRRFVRVLSKREDFVHAEFSISPPACYYLPTKCGMSFSFSKQTKSSNSVLSTIKWFSLIVQGAM